MTGSHAASRIIPRAFPGISPAEVEALISKCKISSYEYELSVAVEEHGIGIAAEALPRVFDRFCHRDRSAEAGFGGLGIGLAITRQVIRQPRGTIAVERAPGHGTTFTLVLPKWGKLKIA